MPWDDDADSSVYIPNENYNELILSLEKEMREDGFRLLKNYDANYFHICKVGAKHNFPYIDWYQGDTNSKEIHSLKKIPFEDFEVFAPNNRFKNNS